MAKEKPEKVDVVQKDSEEMVKLIERGETLVRLENMTQMSIAKQHKRDLAKVKENALTELSLFPELAEAAIYNKPVGKNDQGEMQYAEGLSIRAAESLALHLGNNAYGAELVVDNDDAVILAGIWLDYETNARRIFLRRVSKSYTSRAGKVIEYRPDRYDLVLAANQSKVLREVILRNISPGLRLSYEREVRNMLAKKAQKQRPAERQKLLLKEFSKLKITQKQLETLRGKPVAKFDEEDIVELRGVYNALREGETTIDELFQQGSQNSPKPNLRPQTQKQKGNEAAAEFEKDYNLGETSTPEATTPSAPPQPTVSESMLFTTIRKALIEKAVDARVLSSRRELEKEEKDALLTCIWNRLGGKWPTSKKDEDYCIAEIRLNDFLFAGKSTAESPGGKDAQAKESDAGDSAYEYVCGRYPNHKFKSSDIVEQSAPLKCPTCFAKLYPIEKQES